MSPAKRTDITNRMGEIAEELRNAFVRGDNKYAAVMEATVLVERIKQKVRAARRWGAEALAPDLPAGKPAKLPSAWKWGPERPPIENISAYGPEAPLTAADIENRPGAIVTARASRVLDAYVERPRYPSREDIPSVVERVIAAAAAEYRRQIEPLAWGLSVNSIPCCADPDEQC